jgi:aminobenzoyl-glutamate utilization protein A
LEEPVELGYAAEQSPRPMHGSAWSKPTAEAVAALVAQARELQPQLVADRRIFHKHPELGWLEFDTTQRIAAQLSSLGYQVTAGEQFLGTAERMGLPKDVKAPHPPGQTGCLAEWACPQPGPTVVVRLDIDALPVDEAGAPHRPAVEGWASERPGVMHACGHDGHIAMGLGLAALLRPRLMRGKGRLKLLFQPAEEGTRGARAILDAGHVDDADLFLGLHLGLGVPSGSVALGTKGFLATRKYEITFRGRSAHAGKEPEEGRSALLAAAQAALGLHTLAQHSEAGIRVNVGTLNAGTAANVVPESASMAFELRAPTQAMLEGSAAAFETTMSARLVGEATDAQTDPEVARWTKHVCESASLFANYRMDHLFGASEDATLLMRRVQDRGGQASYFVLGTDLASPHHTPRFDFDETVLASGVALLALVVTSALNLS